MEQIEGTKCNGKRVIMITLTIEGTEPGTRFALGLLSVNIKLK